MKNGYSTALAMLTQVVGASGPFTDKISLKQLKCFTGHDANALTEAQLSLIEENGYPFFQFQNLAIPSYQLRAGEWHCPHCYGETGYLRGSWRIAWLPICTKHECALEPLAKSHMIDPYLQKKHHFLLHAANDWPIPRDVIELQILLEQRLMEETGRLEALPIEDNIITLIDTFLLRALGLNDVSDLQNRKRRYPLKYFPLNFDDTMKFMECLYVQLVAEKRLRA